MQSILDAVRFGELCLDSQISVKSKCHVLILFAVDSACLCKRCRLEVLGVNPAQDPLSHVPPLSFYAQIIICTAFN